MTHRGQSSGSRGVYSFKNELEKGIAEKQTYSQSKRQIMLLRFACRSPHDHCHREIDTLYYQCPVCKQLSYTCEHSGLASALDSSLRYKKQRQPPDICCLEYKLRARTSEHFCDQEPMGKNFVQRLDKCIQDTLLLSKDIESTELCYDANSRKNLKASLRLSLTL